MAWLMARICCSLKEFLREDPRWPDVPKATWCAWLSGSGSCVKYAVTRRGRFCSSSLGAGLPASGCRAMAAILSFLSDAYDGGNWRPCHVTRVLSYRRGVTCFSGNADHVYALRLIQNVRQR